MSLTAFKRAPIVASLGAIALVLSVMSTSTATAQTPPTADVSAVCPATDPAADPAFPDLGVHRPAIDCFAGFGIVNGFADGTFGPGRSLRRDQMASVIVRYIEVARDAPLPRSEPSLEDFEDVDPASTHADAIGALASTGITQGVDENSYRPSSTVTRAQMATFVHRTLDLLDDGEINGSYPPPGTASFTDVPDGMTHAENIRALRSLDVVLGAGDGTFGPQEPVLRGQVVTLFARAASLLLAFDAWAPGAQPSGPVPPGSDDQRIDLKLLLIGHDQAGQPDGVPPSLAAWKALLDRQGVDYEVRTAEQEIRPEDLAVDGQHARYQGVVLASSVTWSLLSDDERAALDAFQRDFGTRRITAYVWPDATYGLDPDQAVGGTGLAEAALTSAGEDVFPQLRGPVPIASWAWGYSGSTPAAGSDVTTLVSGADGSTLIGIHRPGDGREEMVATVDSNPSAIHTQLLLPGMLEWLTRGVHTGYDRHHLSLHIDDIFLADDRWDMTTNTTPGDGENPIRMTAADVTRARAWQARTGIALDMVYNGLGGTEEQFPNDQLTAELLEHKAEFRWINHTYTHLNLDAPAQETIVGEVRDNIDFAAQRGLMIDPTELVTGEHSGLENPAMPAALEEAGIRWIASDNSRSPQQAQVGPALTVPRHPANLYYNVGTFEEQLDEYNFIYSEPQCQNTAVNTCLTEPATWSQYVDAEATLMFSHIVQGDPRPHYLHQSNLAEDGTMYPIVDEAMDRYRRLFRTDPIQPTMSEAGGLLRDQRLWQEALASGAASAYLSDGVVHVTADGPTQVPLSGTEVGVVYGGVRSGWVTVDGTRPFAPVNDPGYGAAGASAFALASEPPVQRGGPDELGSSEPPMPLPPPGDER